MALSDFNLTESQGFILTLPTIPPHTLSETLKKTISRNNPFHINIVSSVLPGLTFDIEDTSHMLKHREITGRITYEPWNVSFLVDEQLENYKVFFKWLQYIDSNIGKKIKHSKDEYKIDGFLQTLSNYRKDTALFKFINLSPTGLGEITLNYQETTYLTCEVTFEYDYIEIGE